MGAIDELAEWAKNQQTTLEHRDRLICQLRDQGVSLREIARAAGLSHTAVAKIVARKET